MSKIDGMHNSSTYKTDILGFMQLVIMDFALHTLHNQHPSISDHIYNVDNTHDNNTPHSPSEDTDQRRHPPNGTRVFAVHVKKFNS